jgi:hypothetical protein
VPKTKRKGSVSPDSQRCQMLHGEESVRAIGGVRLCAQCIEKVRAIARDAGVRFA